MNPQIGYILQKTLYAFWYLDCAYSVVIKDFADMFHAGTFMIIHAFILHYLYGEGE